MLKNKLNATDLFVTCEGDIRKAAKAFHGNYNWIPITDFFYEGMKAFLSAYDKYDASKKASFRTFLHICMRHEMINLVNKSRKRRTTNILPRYINTNPFKTRMKWLALFSALTNDAQEVCKVLFTSQDKGVFDGVPPRYVRGKLANEMMKLGWGRNKVFGIFKEIRLAVK